MTSPDFLSSFGIIFYPLCPAPSPPPLNLQDPAGLQVLQETSSEPLCRETCQLCVSMSPRAHSIVASITFSRNHLCGCPFHLIINSSMGRLFPSLLGSRLVLSEQQLQRLGSGECFPVSRGLSYGNLSRRGGSRWTANLVREAEG